MNTHTLTHTHTHTHTHTDTDNELAVDGGYENISVAYQPAQPTLDFLKFINNNIEPGDTSADCILSLYSHVVTSYRRFGNFHVKILSYNIFLCKIFLRTTPYHINVNSAH